MALVDPPPSLKLTSMFLKCATEYETRDPVIAYYCRLCAFQKGFSLDASSPEAKAFLNKLMTHLEASKKQLSNNEAITNNAVGLAYVEQYALKLFNFAYHRDADADFGKATVKSFYTAGILLDVAATLGDVNDELEKSRKYAKWKTIYITQCQKNGETPIAGPAAATGTDQLPAIDIPTVPASQPQRPSSSVTKPTVPPTQPERFSDKEDQDSDGNDNVDSISPETYSAVEKCVRYALSALVHRDKKTVVDNLVQALSMLRS